MTVIRSGVGVVIVVLWCAIAGCAPVRSGSEAIPVAPGTSASPTPSCAGRPQPVVGLTEVDSGTTVCLSVGDRLEVYLSGSTVQMWQPLQESGGALAVAVSGKRTLALGVTAAFFSAATPGVALLSSHRPACDPASPSPSGPVCQPASDFNVTAVIH